MRVASPAATSKGPFGIRYRSAAYREIRSSHDFAAPESADFCYEFCVSLAPIHLVVQKQELRLSATCDFGEFDRENTHLTAFADQFVTSVIGVSC